MSLTERLKDFAGALTTATFGPDEYPSYASYHANMQDLKELWSEIQPQLKRDVDNARFISEKLAEIFEAFENGERERGRKAVWAIYNLKVTRLR